MFLNVILNLKCTGRGGQQNWIVVVGTPQKSSAPQYTFENGIALSAKTKNISSCSICLSVRTSLLYLVLCDFSTRYNSGVLPSQIDYLHVFGFILQGYPKPWIRMGNVHTISWNSLIAGFFLTLIPFHYKKANHSE